MALLKSLLPYCLHSRIITSDRTDAGEFCLWLLTNVGGIRHDTYKATLKTIRHWPTTTW